MSTTSFLLPAGTIASATDVVGPFDISQYQTIAVQLFGTYAGVNVSFQVSLDGVNWSGIVAATVGSSSVINSATGVLATNSTNAYDLVVGPFSWFRLATTAWTSGTANVNVAGGTVVYEPAGNVQISNAPAVTPTPSATASGITTYHHLVSAATTNATLVKSTAGSIANVIVANTVASWRYLKFYNKASAPTVGTDVPVTLIGLPPNSTQVINYTLYPRHTTGIGYAITGAAADADTTVIAANDVTISIHYV